MIYRNVRDDSLYQYVGAARMVLGLLPLSNAGTYGTVVMVRDPNGRNHVYLSRISFPEHWVVRGEATLIADPTRILYDDDEMVIYRGADGRWFVAPAEEFFDGRHVAFSG